MAHPASAVTALFVPGDRPDRFAKAAAAGPDVVVIDLEDAVPPGAKEAALAAVLAALSPDAGLRALVRLNAAGTATYDREVGAVAELAARPGHGLLGVLLPKAEDPAALASLIAALARPGSALAVIPLVESALGVVRAFELASVPGVTRLAFGALDFTLDVAADLDSAAVGQARAQLVIGSRAAGVPAPLDSPCTDVRDLERVLAAARESRSAGFGGMLCIHPAQLPAVRAGFAPTAAEIEWARAVIGAEGGDVQGGAVQIGGRMVDRPVVERARRILDAR
ncbi:HpcH/HpaI aldolase/citrate lyase family protein [Microlunatus ginsengisoli]|uniref:CoA ester lyase n=1 Tax=Microlunatus ginsengisoli TaxID=363863 RepID=A0ABP6ZRK3_9ACTN